MLSCRLPKIIFCREGDWRSFFLSRYWNYLFFFLLVGWRRCVVRRFSDKQKPDIALQTICNVNIVKPDRNWKIRKIHILHSKIYLSWNKAIFYIICNKTLTLANYLVLTFCLCYQFVFKLILIEKLLQMGIRNSGLRIGSLALNPLVQCCAYFYMLLILCSLCSTKR